MEACASTNWRPTVIVGRLPCDCTDREETKTRGSCEYDFAGGLILRVGPAQVLPGPPRRANLRTMLGPISSYSALV